MQTILVTTVDERGFQTHNTPVVVLTEEERNSYLEIFHLQATLDETIHDRFQVLTKYAKSLEERIIALESENTLLRGR